MTQYSPGKMSLETFVGEKSGDSIDAYTTALVLDSSKHGSFSVLINNTDDTNGITVVAECSNNPNDETPNWTPYADAINIAAGSSNKISGVTVSNAIKVSVKNQVEGSNSSYIVFGRLNPALIF